MGSQGNVSGAHPEGGSLGPWIGGNIMTMQSGNLSEELRLVRELTGRFDGLELLLLFGSRGRGEPSSVSDWDFAFLGTRGLDVDRLRAELNLCLRTDRVDLVDLNRTTGLLRYRAARDGVVIHESPKGVFNTFWLEAVTFWLDAQPVLQSSYDAVLASLDS